MTLKAKLCPSVIAGLLLVVGCGTGGGSSDAGGVHVDPTFSSIQTNIFNVSCNNASCHSPTGEAISGQLDLTKPNAYVNLLGADGGGAPIPDHNDPGEVQATADGYSLVVPGHPEKSFLLLKITPGLNSKYGIQMPNLGTPLTAEQVQAVSDWISQGAQND
jgi:hypothetical protein